MEGRNVLKQFKDFLKLTPEAESTTDWFRGTSQIIIFLIKNILNLIRSFNNLGHSFNFLNMKGNSNKK